MCVSAHNLTSFECERIVFSAVEVSMMQVRFCEVVCICFDADVKMI